MCGFRCLPGWSGSAWRWRRFGCDDSCPHRPQRKIAQKRPALQEIHPEGPGVRRACAEPKGYRPRSSASLNRNHAEHESTSTISTYIICLGEWKLGAYFKELSVPRFHEVHILVMICAYWSISNASLLHKPIYQIIVAECWWSPFLLAIIDSDARSQAWTAACVCAVFSCLDVQKSSMLSCVVIWSPCGRVHGSVSWVRRKIAARSFFRVFL